MTVHRTNSILVEWCDIYILDKLRYDIFRYDIITYYNILLSMSSMIPSGNLTSRNRPRFTVIFLPIPPRPPGADVLRRHVSCSEA